MSDLHFQIDDPVLLRHPDVRVGAFVVERLEVAAAACGDLGELFRAAGATLRAAGIDLASLVSEPRIAAWRSAIAACGLKASRHRSSPEQLARRLLRDGAIPTPLPIVSLYCALSAKHLAPLGAYDLDRLGSTSLALRPGRPATDSFSPLGGEAEAMPLSDRVVVYAAGDRVVCWAFKVRDSR